MQNVKFWEICMKISRCGSCGNRDFGKLHEIPGYCVMGVPGIPDTVDTVPEKKPENRACNRK